jgi:5'-nucleotidase
MVRGRLVTSAASFGRVITKIDLELDSKEHAVVKKSAKNVVVTRDIPPDPSVSSIIATYQAKSAPLANRVVGHLTADVIANPMTAKSISCETPLGDVIADAQLAATSGVGTGQAVIAFMNPGGIRTDLVHAASGMEGAGVVTYAEAFAVQPFSNKLVTLTLTGAQIKMLLDQQFFPSTPRILQVSSGFTYSYSWDATTKKGTVNASSMKLDGIPVEAGQSYRVTVNSFLAGGGDGFSVLKSGIERLSGIADIDALVAYLGDHDPVAPPTIARVRGDACKSQ